MSGMKDCKFCDKRGLLWLPLRYGAVGAANLAALDALPKLAGKLGTGVSDLALAKAKYAVRLLRSGYLYVLIERKGVKYWEAYRVTDDAFLYKFAPEDPPQMEPSFSCERHTCGINASMVAIPEAKDVPNVWSLFTPAPLTKAKLDEYKANAAKYVGEGKLQTFNPAGWLNGSTEQPHTLLASELMTKVAEFILFKQAGNPYESELGKALEQQLFPANKDAYSGAPPDDKGQYFGRLGSLYNTMKRAGYATFVLHDHIGLTQELNDFRNAALQAVEAFLNKKEGGVENQRRLEVMQAIEDVHAGIKSKFIKRYAQQIAQVDQSNLPDHSAGTVRQLRAMGRHAEADKVEAQAKESKQRKAMNRQRMLDGTDAEQDWQRLYAAHLDQNEVAKFRKALETLSAQCGQVANTRAADHMHWVKSARLVNAFDIFDPTEESCGFVFKQEHMHCTHGMFGVEQNQATLSEWMNIDKVERSNLYMRANLYNHQDLIKQASDTFTAVRKEVRLVTGVEYIAVDKLAKFTKGLVDAFKKSDSAWDEWLRDEAVMDIQKGTSTAKDSKFNKDRDKLPDAQAKKKYDARMGKLSKFHRHNEGLALARIGEWTRGVTRQGGKLDKGIVAVAGLLLYPRLGRLTEHLGMEKFFLKLAKENLASIKEQTQRAVAEGRMTPQQGEQHIKDYEKSGKYAGAAESAARREGAASAKAAVSAEVAAVEGSLERVYHEEQAKLRERISLTQAELDKGERPTPNNFRQLRMGVLLMSLEGLALVSKLEQHQGEWTARGRLEIWGSILSLMSISCDTMYSAAKSIREIEAFAKKVAPNINEAADIIRGGFKITAGVLSTSAGMVSVVLDLQAAFGEAHKEDRNWVLIGIYTSKAVVGGLNATLGFIAAFSYAGPMLRYLGKEALARKAEQVAVARTLWLIRVARFNWIGLALTAIEIGYTCWIKDDELQVWCKTSTFRKDKNTKGIFAKTPYLTTKKELEELQKSFLLVTGQADGPQASQQTPPPQVAQRALPPAASANAPH